MQRHQRGSIIGFVVVGALLAIAVVGGIYLVKNQFNGNMPSIGGGEDTSQVADNDSDNEEITEPAPSDDQAQSDDATNDQPEPETTPETDQDQPATAPEQDDEDVASDRDDMPQTGVESPAPTTGELPQTGPAENLYVLLAIGALTGSIVAYTRSGRL